MSDKLTEYIENEISKIKRVEFPYEKTQDGSLKLSMQKVLEFAQGKISEAELNDSKKEIVSIENKVKAVENIEDHYVAIEKWNHLLGNMVNELDERGAILAYQDLITRYRETNQYEKELQASFEIYGKLGVTDNSLDKYWREKQLMKKIGLDKEIA